MDEEGQLPAEYDGEIAFSEIMELAEREEVHLELVIPAFKLLPGETGHHLTYATVGGIRTTVCKRQGGFRMGVPVQYHPRKGTLKVFIESMGCHKEIEPNNVRFALVGPGDDAWKYKVV